MAVPQICSNPRDNPPPFLQSVLSLSFIHLRQLNPFTFCSLFIHPFFTHTHAIFSSGFKVDVKLPHCHADSRRSLQTAGQTSNPINKGHRRMEGLVGQVVSHLSDIKHKTMLELYDFKNVQYTVKN